MGFYRLFTSKDTWISNASTDGTNGHRMTGSNFGMSPTLQLFAVKNAVESGSYELSRILLQFNLNELSGKIFDEKTVPSSSVNYFLRLANYQHATTIPTSYELFAYPLSKSWTEGTGSDQVTFRDYGWANWLSASSTTAWDVTGSDFQATNYGSGSQAFDRGWEDLEVNVTQVVNNWLTSSIGQAGGFPNNGLVVKYGASEESNGVDYNLKMFHSKETKYVDKIPHIEARWDSDVIRDNRKNFAYNVPNRLYFYNFSRGQLSGTNEPLIVKIKDHWMNASASFNVELTSSKVATGIYSASLQVENFTASFSSSWVDVWFAGARVYMTGNFKPVFLSGSEVDPYEEYTMDVLNLKGEYSANEQARMKVGVRKKNLKKSHIRIVHTASTDVDKEYMDEMYYSVINDETGEVVIPFGTGSVDYTRLSYNGEGNYFDMFMNGYIPGFVYRLKFLIVSNKEKTVLDEGWKFKVV